MELLLVLFFVFYLLSGHIGGFSTNAGYLLFMKSGSSERLDDMWGNTTYTETTNPNRHTQFVQQFIADGTNFRSQLIDIWDEIQPIFVEVDLLNQDGQLMDKLCFDVLGSDMDFVANGQYISNIDASVEVDPGFGPSLIVCNASDEGLFSFMSLHMADHIAGISGEQFIISGNADFVSLSKGDYLGCYLLQPTDNVIDVLGTFECSVHCLTISGCLYFGLFTVDDTVSSQPVHRCVPIRTAPDVFATQCAVECSQNDGFCGASHVESNPTYVNADIYSIAPNISEEFKDMKQITTSEEIVVSDMNSAVDPVDRAYSYFLQIDLGSPVYVSGIEVPVQDLLVGNDTFKLLFAVEPCSELFNLYLSFHSDSFYHGYNCGGVRIYEVGIAYTFEPVKAQCIYFNATASFITKKVKLNRVTNKFVLASYLSVYAQWTNDVCLDEEIMSDASVVPDDSVIINQMDLKSLDFSYGTAFMVPGVSDAKIFIYLQDKYREFWVQNIALTASAAASIIIEVETNKMCTNQQNGYLNFVNISYTKEQTIKGYQVMTESFEILRNSSQAVCIGMIKLTVSAMNPDSTHMFSFKMNVSGCVIDHEDFLSSYNTRNLIDTGEVIVEGQWKARPMYANAALRPTGNGLVLSNIGQGAYIRVDLLTERTVKMIKIWGSVSQATVYAGGQMKVAELISGYPVEVKFNNIISLGIIIDEIERDSSQSDLYPMMKLEIIVCSLPSGLLSVPIKNNSLISVTSSSPPTFDLSTSQNVPTLENPITTVDIGSGDGITSSTGTSTASSVSVTTTAAHQTTETPSQTTPPLSATTVMPMCYCKNQTVNCKNRTVNVTEEELVEVINEIIKNLTIPKNETAAFRRSKVCAEDKRESSTIIGSVGAALMVTSCMMFVIMDAGHIFRLATFIKSVLFN